MELIKNLINGTIFGIANIIPGVSGGTMALVLGFYERLISAINNISGNTIKAFFGLLKFNIEGFEKFKSEMKRIDAVFLITIAVGALSAITALAKLMTYLLKNWHDPTYGFFFGLVLLSAVVPYKLIKKKSAPVFLSVLIAAAGVISISISISDADIINKAKIKHELKVKSESGSNVEIKLLNLNQKRDIIRYLLLFLMGAVTISATILPGVSGAFLLLLMGGYFEILAALVNRDYPVLGIFGLGCVLGLLVFSRILNFFLQRWHDITMGVLLGLVIGSLWMIWPFRGTEIIGGETIYLSGIIPEVFGKNEIYTSLTAFAGMLSVYLMIRLETIMGK